MSAIGLPPFSGFSTLTSFLFFLQRRYRPREQVGPGGGRIFALSITYGLRNLATSRTVHYVAVYQYLVTINDINSGALKRPSGHSKTDRMIVRSVWTLLYVLQQYYRSVKYFNG